MNFQKLNGVTYFATAPRTTYSAAAPANSFAAVPYSFAAVPTGYSQQYAAAAAATGTQMVGAYNNMVLP